MEESSISKPPCKSPSSAETSLHGLESSEIFLSVCIVHVAEEHVHTPASVSQYDGGPHVPPHASHKVFFSGLHVYTLANLESDPNISSNVPPLSFVFQPVISWLNA